MNVVYKNMLDSTLVEYQVEKNYRVVKFLKESDILIPYLGSIQL